MAIQNFISGGFYGKLGEVVGQRWRNKRTIRRYVIGANPQTPLQQANRQNFRKAIELAQFAMNINKSAPAWDNEAVPEFSLRTGTAKSRLQLGLSESEAIPLFPDGYVPYHSFTYASLYGPEETDNHRFTLIPYPPLGSRHFSAAIYCRNLLTGEWVTLYLQDQLPATNPCYFEPVLSVKYGFLPGSWIIGTTYDDRDNSGNMYYLPKKSVSEEDPPIRHYRGSFASITWFSDRFEALYTTPNTPFEDIGAIPVTLYCKYNGIMQNVAGLGTLTWVSGKNWKITGPRAANIQYPENSGIRELFYEDPRTYYFRLIEMEGTSIQEP
jgi:hypothetical protein